MPIETAQLLCGAHHVLNPEKYEVPYKKTHINHPCAKWVRTSKENYLWAVEYGISLSETYTKVYKKHHASQDIIEWAFENVDKLNFPFNDLTEFKQAMPEQYQQVHDAPAAYQEYFRNDKRHIAQWKQGAPSWWY